MGNVDPAICEHSPTTMTSEPTSTVRWWCSGVGRTLHCCTVLKDGSKASTDAPARPDRHELAAEDPAWGRERSAADWRTWTAGAPCLPPARRLPCTSQGTMEKLVIV
ncbi:hypothetical protein V5799_012770 [Amblyomma americanum]|uniref:Uncharacterized protein n=1 Tax=Amblyomma americanum TaxID=6943 RepID=A0AAQ4E7X3_AMBAM